MGGSIIELGKGFWGDGGSGNGSAGFWIGSGASYEAGPRMFEWKGIFLVVFEPAVGGSECIQC